MMVWLINWLGLPLFGYTLYITWGTAQLWIVLALCVLIGVVKVAFGVAKIYFYIKKSKQDLRMRELKIEEKEIEMSDEK